MLLRARLALLPLALVACSHTYFQYRLSPDDERTLRKTVAADIAAASEHDAARAGAALDPEGRKASLFAAHDLIANRSDATKKLDAFVAAVIFLSGWELPAGDVDLVTAAAPWLRHRIEKAVATSLFTHGDREPLPDLVAELAPDPEQRRTRLAAQLIDQLPAGCTFARTIVSYRADILDHLDWDWAARSRTFKAWKHDVLSLHLVQLRCADRTGLWLMDRYASGGPLLLGWHYFTAEQWAKVEPKLEHSLDL